MTLDADRCPFARNHPHYQPPHGFAPCTRPLVNGYHDGPCAHPPLFSLQPLTDDELGDLTCRPWRGISVALLELRQYRLAVPQLVEDIAKLQKDVADLKQKLEDERTVAEFWKLACGRAMQLNEQNEDVAVKLRERLIHACDDVLPWLACLELDDEDDIESLGHLRDHLRKVKTEAEAE